ncbi:MAG: sensor histidine kinase [Eubacteriales bacterium]|nr:sensor histidine kinase [Eubacteriales bacterium]
MKKYKNWKLITKVVMSMTVIILIYSIIFIVVSVRNAQREINAQIEISNEESLEQFNNYLNTLQTDLLNISSLTYTNDTVLDIVSGAQDFSGTKSKTVLNNFLLGMTLFKDDIDFTGIINEQSLSDGYYVAKDNSFGMREYTELVESEIFRDFTASGQDYACYLLGKEDTSVILQNRMDKLLYIRTLRNPQKNFELQGYLLLGVNLEHLTDFCRSFLKDDSSSLAVYDNKGNQLFSAGNELPEAVLKNGDKEKISHQLIDSRQHLVCFTDRNSLGWKIYYDMDLSRIIKKDFWNSYAYVILIALAAVSVFGIMAVLLTKAVTSPLKKLIGSMEKFQKGDFDQYVEVKYEDEIGQLTRGYNHMVSHIKDLIHQNYAIKMKEQEAMLGALQAQINPHFLYNMLDLIYWKASACGQTEIADTIYSMAKLFRLSLNKGEMWLTIKDEKEFLMHYLTLQKSLMSEQLSSAINVEKGLENVRIPRFLLQPFVENSIVHGFSKRVEKPEIIVSFSRNGKNLVIILTDNGCGMTSEESERIFDVEAEKSGEKKESSSYAISNVIKRLRLYFGEGFSLNIKSQPGNGTEIILILNNFLDFDREDQVMLRQHSGLLLSAEEGEGRQ